MSFTGYLSEQEIITLRDALISAGLAHHESQDALIVALLPQYAAGIPTPAKPDVRLFVTLHMINRVHNLRNGDVPLAQYLRAAQSFAGSVPAADVIDQMLKKASTSSAAALPTAVVAAAPVAAPNLDVRPEAQIGAMDQTLSVRFLRDGFAASSSVVKLLVHRHVDGVAEFLAGGEPRLVNGTGWIIAPGLLITNHHVIDARRKEGNVEPSATSEDHRIQAEHVTMLFDYIDKGREPAPYRTEAGALQFSDPTLDFAILRVPATAPSRPPLRLRRHAIRKTPQQALGTCVNLLQHPNGDPMRLGFRNNYVVIGDLESLSYLTDTAVGSSGSPVCDDSWTVAGLHAGSRAISAENIEILGQKYRRENHGTPIVTILELLKTAHPALCTEIKAGQGWTD